jgi:hypothetical protein
MRMSCSVSPAMCVSAMVRSFTRVISTPSTIETHEAFWQQVVQTMDGLDGVVWVAGSMDGLEEAFCEPQAR